MNKLFVFIIFLTGSALSVSAQETETRSLSDFSEISVGEAINVTLVPGNKNEAVVKVRNIDLEDVETDVRGGTLKIELSGSRYRNIDVEITLTYKSIEGLHVSSAADVVTKGAIKSSSLDLSVSSAANAVLEIVAEKIDVEVSSSGDLELTGKTTSQRVSVSSAGDYDAYDLSCDEAYVRASSAGSARINVTKKIDAKASSAGSIKYRGEPDKVYVNSSSGGDVDKSN
jgi:hypothetical protein